MANGHNNNRLEQNLEELSWEFVLDLDSEEKGEEIFLEEKEEIPVQQEEAIQKDVGSLYHSDASSFLGINDLNRDSGIIFDEQKLEANKVTEWSKAPRVKESQFKKVFLGITKILTLPFVLIFQGVASIFKSIFWLIQKISIYLYLVSKFVFLFPYKLLLAFGASFKYLFGDFSWPKVRRPVAVYVEPAPRSIALYSRWKAIGVFILVAAILVLPIQGYVLYRQSQEIKGEVMGASLSGVDHLKQAGTSGTQLDFQTAEDQFALAEKDFLQAEKSFLELEESTTKLATLIPEVKTGQNLISIAKNSAQIGSHLSKVAQVFDNIDISIPQDSQAGMALDNQEKSSGLSSIDNELSLALSKAKDIAQVLNRINLSQIGFAEYQDQFEDIKKQLPALLAFLEQSKDIFKVITHFLGADEPQRFMLVFQNNGELRATGGFPGSYAILDIADGKIENIQVPGGGFYDLKGSLQVKVDAPYPFHLFSPIWQPWNFNWFPDWKASAQKIMWFYENSGGPTVDGVIAFTPNVLEDLLTLTGEINMPEYDTSVNSQNFVRMTQMEVEFDYDKEENKPKKFIGDLLPQVLEKTLALKDDKLTDILDIITKSLAQKHLLVYFSDENLEQIVENLNWSGSIPATRGDYLSVVHTNIAGGKTDRIIETNILHEVEVMPDGLLVASVTVNKKHNGQEDDVFEGQANTDYLRVYVPQGSKLVAATGFDPMPTDRIFQMALEEDQIEEDPHLSKFETNLRTDQESHTRITDQFGKTCFANWMIVEPGQQKSVKLSYILPFRFQPEVQISATDNTSLFSRIKQYFFGKEDNQPISLPNEYVYSLLAQKQSGNDNQKIISRISLANNWQINDFLPKNSDIKTTTNNSIYTTDLDTNKYYGLSLRKDQ